MKVRTNKKYAVISVSAGTGCYRHVKVPLNKKLSWFADVILDLFEFDNDHLYAFFMNNRLWDDSDAYYFQPDDYFSRNVEKYKLSEAGITDKKQFKFLFDFGDEWVFQCKVLRIENDGKDDAELLRSVGEPPEQYPDYDDWDEEEFWDEDNDSSRADNEDVDNIIDHLFEENAVEAAEEELYSCVSDSLYNAALEFNRVKGSRKTYIDDLIAVKLSNGSTGYISYSEDGNIPTVYFFPGIEGFDMYKAMEENFHDNKRINEVEIAGVAYACSYFSKDNLDEITYEALRNYAVRKEHNIRKFPLFSHHFTMFIPTAIDEKESGDLFEEALRALTFVFKNFSKYSNAVREWPQFGKLLYVIPDGQNFRTEETEMPEPVYFAIESPEIKTNKLPKKGRWACEITSSYDYAPSDFDDTPHLFYALAMIRLDGKGSLNSVFDLDAEYKNIVRYINDGFNTLGYYPEEIQVRNGFTGAILKKFCKSAGICLSDNDDIPELDAALESDECNPAAEEETDGYSDQYEARKIHEKRDPEFAAMLKSIEEMISMMSVKELKSFKKESIEFWNCLKDAYESKFFESEIMEKLKKVFG